MTEFHLLALGWFAFTVALYLGMKALYQRYSKWWLMPMLAVPVVLIVCLLLSHQSFSVYFADTRWLVWMLGPATVAFAVPIYEYRQLILRHWLALAVGVVAGITAAVTSSIFLARLFGLSPALQASLAPRSVSTPFAMAVAPQLGGSSDLTAVFVVLTGVFGMLLGELMLALLPLRSRLARGALFGASSHGAGTAKAMEIGQEEGVVSSLVMMISGVATVFAEPLIAHLV
ncbi:LrgB family protein [Azospira inquinata]|uniref:LrgB family protein n=1 Tax=Azospira inquinata TaxID=2785627 RepID=A0A975SNS0_9RHOO|nr:LrgB family protein [Azospira inquinata]QWT45488.1 LrgB family protein [Azospira inquinata]QWT49184.1 LrgB family protein [Azospira inquinata]